MSGHSRDTRRNSGVRLPVWALVLLLGLGLLLLIGSSVWLFRTVRGIAAIRDGTGEEFVPVPGQTTSGGTTAPEVQAEP